jgi:hypothetical protein
MIEVYFATVVALDLILTLCFPNSGHVVHPPAF